MRSLWAVCTESNPLDTVHPPGDASIEPEEVRISQEHLEQASSASSRNKRIVQGLISLVVVVAIFAFALPKMADFSEVWIELKAMSWIELATLFVAAVWNLASYWLVGISSLPGSNVWQVMKVTATGTAVANTLPGGGAIGIAVTYGMYSQYGFSGSEISLSVLVTGIWNNFVKLGMPVIALGLLVFQGSASSGLVVAAFIGLAVLIGSIVLFALVLKSERAAVRVGEGLGGFVSLVKGVFRKDPVTGWGESFARFRRDCIGLLRKRWAALTLSTLVSHLSLYLVLLLALRHVGVSEQEVSSAEVLAAFAFIRLITALPITPGGLGVVELGAAAALVAAGGNEAQVVAGVLVYRAFTYLLPIPFGLFMYVNWRGGSRRRKEKLQASKSATTLASKAGGGE